MSILFNCPATNELFEPVLTEYRNVVEQWVLEMMDNPEGEYEPEKQYWWAVVNIEMPNSYLSGWEIYLYARGRITPEQLKMILVQGRLIVCGDNDHPSMKRMVTGLIATGTTRSRSLVLRAWPKTGPTSKPVPGLDQGIERKKPRWF